MKNIHSKWLVPSLLISSITLGSAQAACVAPPDNMIGWWTGDDHAKDITEGEHHGSLQGGATSDAQGIVANAFDLNKANQKDYVLIKDHAAFDFSFTQSFTLDAWIKASEEQSKGAVGIISKSKSGRDSGRYALQLYTKNGVSKADFFTSESHGAANDNLQGTSQLNDGQWHHIAATYDASTQKKRLFVDGREEASAQLDLQSDNFHSTGALIFGQHAAGGASNYNGYLDEVEIFDRALEQKEIMSIVKAGEDGKCKKKL